MSNLTDLAIRSLKAPVKGQKNYFDSALPGFGVRVSQGGTRSFFLFTGKAHNRRRHAIGRFGIITLAQARAEAKRLLAEQTLGHGKPKSITFSAALTIFEEQKYPELKARIPRSSAVTLVPEMMPHMSSRSVLPSSRVKHV